MTRIDRRTLFARGGAAALLAAAGLSADAAPRTGGTLRLAVPRDGSLGLVARGAVFDTLTEIAPDGTLRGELAAGWSTNADASVWRFALRDGVRFHDGAPLDVADVLAVLSDLGRAAATGPRSLRLELAAGDFGLPFRLAGTRFAIPRAGAARAQLAQAVGTGCYQVERAQDGRHFRARRVQDHYRSGQAGWIDALDVIVIPDAGVRAEALRDGFVDAAALPHPQGLRGRTRFRFHPSASDVVIAVSGSVGLPRRIGASAPLDDGRLAERWWMI